MLLDKFYESYTLLLAKLIHVFDLAVTQAVSWSGIITDFEAFKSPEANQTF